MDKINNKIIYIETKRIRDILTMMPYIAASDNQFWQQSPTKIEFNKLTQSNITPNPTCSHHLKILQLRHKIKQLEQIQQRLQRENDQIINTMELSSREEKRKQQEGLMWQKKYQKLKAENDKKANKLALMHSSALSNVNLNRQKYSQKYAQHQPQKNLTMRKDIKPTFTSTQSREKIRQRISNMDHMLTKQQKQYVRHLQQGRKQRSSSMKQLNIVQSSKDSKKYSAKLPDGLIIHIIDNRDKNHHHRSVRY